MVMRRLRGRKKEDKEETDAEVEEDIEDLELEDDIIAASETTPDETVKEELEYEIVEEVEIEDVGGTIPYHDTIQDRLMYLFNDPEISGSIEGPDEFCLEFMAMGERFRIEKESLGEIQVQTGAAPKHDAHIRIGNDVVQDLLSAATFKEFSDIFMQFYKSPEAGKFVKIEIREDVSNLNRRGYARVSLLKLLIGAAR
ncbi:MAG: hypothetical protein RTU30_02625 [Candidatus Thorarchaeota archaeon]